MSKTLTKYRPTEMTWAIGLVFFGLMIWFISRGRSQYNEERVTIERDEKGRIASLSVNRSAH